MLVLIVVGTILYYKPLSGSYVFAGPDSLAPEALGAGLKTLEQDSGDWPLWNPYIFSGMPTLHSFTGISRVYLPELITKILVFVGLPVFSVFLLHLIFGGFGCFVLLRRIGGSFTAGLLGGTGFMLMPYINSMMVNGHGSMMMTLAYLPWVIWAILRLYEKASLGSAALLALLVGLQLQRGHAQISYYILLMLGLFFIVLVVRSWRDPERDASRNWRFTILFVLTMVIGFGLATSLFLPIMNYTPYSIRGGQVGGGAGFEYATQWSFSFGETLTFISPSFYGFGGVTYWGGMPFTDYPNYMGIILLVLAGWAVATKRNWLVWTLAAGGFLAYLISLGHNFFVYRIFYNWFPYFNKFRVPAMILVLTQFSVVVLAGIGLDSWLEWLKARKTEKAKKILLWLAGAVAAVSVLLLLITTLLEGSFSLIEGVSEQMMPVINNLRLSMIRQDAVMLLIIGGLAIAAFYYWLQGRIPQRWLLVGLMALSVVDLGRVDWQIIEPPTDSLRSQVLQPRSYTQRYVNTDPVLDFLGSDSSTFRILPLNPLQLENRWAVKGIESITGYHAAKLASYDRFMQLTLFQSEGIWRMLNVKYLVSLQRVADPRFTEAFVGNFYYNGSYQPAAVYEFIPHMERVWFPRRVEVRSTENEILARLIDSQYNPEEVVYIQDESPEEQMVPLSGGSGRILEADWGAEHIRLRVEADATSLVVISEIFYPEGWVARLEGEPTPIYNVNTILRGVIVPAGTHELTMDFEPKDVRLGRWISNLCLLVIGLGFIPGAVTRLRPLLPTRKAALSDQA